MNPTRHARLGLTSLRPRAVRAQVLGRKVGVGSDGGAPERTLRLADLLEPCRRAAQELGALPGSHGQLVADEVAEQPRERVPLAMVEPQPHRDPPIRQVDERVSGLVATKNLGELGAKGVVRRDPLDQLADLR
jgi:hypothetical protein